MQPADIRIPAQKPQQLPEHAAGVNLLRRYQRESLAQIKDHLVTEDADRPRSGTVLAAHALVKDPPQQVEVDLHSAPLQMGDDRRNNRANSLSSVADGVLDLRSHLSTGEVRSEERRVGKEWRSRW